MLLHESATSMEQSIPENLSTHVYKECEVNQSVVPCRDSGEGDHLELAPTKFDPRPDVSPPHDHASLSSPAPASTTKVKLSFSVDRLLGTEPPSGSRHPSVSSAKSCCDGSIFSCCSFPHCYKQSAVEASKIGYVPIPVAAPATATHPFPYAGLDKLYPSLYMDYKSVVRPLPVRQSDHATSSYPALATNALLRFHQHQHLQHKSPHSPGAAPPPGAPLLAPLHSLKSLQLAHQQRFLGKAPQNLDGIAAPTGGAPSLPTATNNSGHHGNGSASGSAGSHSSNTNGKRKRSWSRAVFTNLQRKGLEIQFQQQKYITKPDRRKLAARLSLTDAQVKVWFQNRRMKWRHTRENLKSGQEKQPHQQSMTAPGANETGGLGSKSGGKPPEVLDYSSDSCSSVELSEEADDDDTLEIDVVE
ncbi:hypothetical protein KR018_000505 [Drosophila ironensis]|nr:hypothetical protein KR018_000505 [Drosophila ironensis]